jgi:hypothetical protein
VFAGQDVLAAGQRVDDGAVVKAAGQGKVTRIGGIGIQVGERLVHPAKLAGEDFLHLLGIERRKHALEIIGKAAGDLKGARVADQPPGIAQSGHHLVLGVKRNPTAVQIEPGRADFAGPQFVEDAPAVGDRGHITVACRRLARGQFGDKAIDPLAEPRVAGGRPRMGAGTQEMPAAMAGHAHFLPAAVVRRLGLEPGADAEVGQQAVRLQFQQPAQAGLLGLLERPRQQPHLVRQKGPDARRLLRLNLQLQAGRGGQIGAGRTGGCRQNSQRHKKKPNPGWQCLHGSSRVFEAGESSGKRACGAESFPTGQKDRVTVIMAVCGEEEKGQAP